MVITDLATVPEPAVPDLRISTVTSEGIQLILAQARAAGLFGPSRAYTSQLPPNAMEVFALSLGSVTRTQSFANDAHEVSVDPPYGAGPAVRLAGRRFADLERKLFTLSSWLPAGSVGPASPYVTFERMAVYMSTPSQDRPATPTVTWPLSTPLATFGTPSSVAGFRCGIVAGGELANVLAAAKKATVDTPWTSSGKTYPVALRPVLPGDPDC
jgi:hypothetical protein